MSWPARTGRRVAEAAAAPHLTIGLTAWREGEDLRDAFASVAAQDDDRWECVAVLDGGADTATRRVFEALEHPRLRRHRFADNQGPYATRRRATEMARCEWYAHLDADDRLPRGAVTRILAAVDRDPEASFVYGDYRVLTAGGVQETRHAGEVVAAALADGPGTTNLIGTSPIRLDLLERLGGYAPELRRGGADWDFWIGALEAGARGVRADGVIYQRRQRAGSNSAGWLLRRDEIVEVLIERHPDFFADPALRARARAKACEVIARVHRAAGRRREAAVYARRAMGHGLDTPNLRAILDEDAMPGWRYRLRRLARRLEAREVR